MICKVTGPTGKRTYRGDVLLNPKTLRGTASSEELKAAFGEDGSIRLVSGTTVVVLIPHNCVMSVGRIRHPYAQVLGPATHDIEIENLKLIVKVESGRRTYKKTKT